MASTIRIDPAPGSGEQSRFFVNGIQVSEAEYDKSLAQDSRLNELFSSRETPGGHLPSCWPMKGCDALMLHPRQLTKQQEIALAAGVPTEFDHECRPIFRDRNHRKEYMGKVERVIDRSGGYGDRT